MKEENNQNQNRNSNAKTTDENLNGSWWSKKKILAIGLSLAILVLSIQVYSIFTNQNIEFEELDVEPKEVVSGNSVTVWFNAKNTTEDDGPILSSLKKLTPIWNFLNEEFSPQEEFTLKINGETVKTEKVKLAINQEKRINFEISRDPGSYQVSVGNLSKNFSVLEPAKFEGSELLISPDEIMLGEGAKISFKVQNTGDVEGEKLIELKVNEIIDEKNVRLEPGEKKEITFDLNLKSEGKHEIEIIGLSEVLEGTISVRDPVNDPLSYPKYYYDTAKTYVSSNYEIPKEKNIHGLANFLHQVFLRKYSIDVFDCSEMTSIVEWMVEGAGFKGEIALNYSLEKQEIPELAHSWVMVDLGNKKVAIETTYLAEGNYYPPGIVESPDGDFEEYSYVTYYNKTHSGSRIREDDSLKQELYNPKASYESPKAILESSGEYHIPENELDWWEVSPYNSMEPFSQWN